MTKIVYLPANHDPIEVDGVDGDSVMFTAAQHGVAGITGECGGVLSCATCHVYVDAGWLDQLPAPSEDELDMLDATAAERRPESRLSCQIELSPELDGLVVRIPDEQ